MYRYASHMFYSRIAMRKSSIIPSRVSPYTVRLNIPRSDGPTAKGVEIVVFVASARLLHRLQYAYFFVGAALYAMGDWKRKLADLAGRLIE